MAFPEGTRSKDGFISPFKRGIFLLAQEAKVSIVPMAIEGAQRVVAPIGFDPKPGDIRIVIGDPITVLSPEEEKLSSLRDRVFHAVTELHESIGGQGARA